MSEIKMNELTAIIDTREQTPWNLSPMQSKPGTLVVGDYSLLGMEQVIAIERKSLQDFVACCGTERERFQRELDRLRGWQVSAVIIEASWADMQLGQWRSKLTPKQVQASFCAWIAQGHRMILGKSHTEASKIAAAVMLYTARYRHRECKHFLEAIART